MSDHAREKTPSQPFAAPREEPEKARPKDDLNWRTCGIIELAIRNVNVASYMEHWEGRALKAEAALAALSTPSPVSPEKEKAEATHEQRANAMRDEMCRALSATGAYPHEVPAILKAALEADNHRLDVIAASRPSAAPVSQLETDIAAYLDSDLHDYVKAYALLKRARTNLQPAAPVSEEIAKLRDKWRVESREIQADYDNRHPKMARAKGLSDCADELDTLLSVRERGERT